jgi:hypothetical protein
MSEILPLLIEISELTDRSDVAWLEDVKVGVCTLMRHVLSNDSPLHSFTVHDSRREDCVTICLCMVKLAARADDKLELTHTLRARLHSLTSKFICVTLNANRSGMLRCVDKREARQSLARQLEL